MQKNQYKTCTAIRLVSLLSLSILFSCTNTKNIFNVTAASNSLLSIDERVEFLDHNSSIASQSTDAMLSFVNDNIDKINMNHLSEKSINERVDRLKSYADEIKVNQNSRLEEDNGNTLCQKFKTIFNRTVPKIKFIGCIGVSACAAYGIYHFMTCHIGDDSIHSDEAIASLIQSSSFNHIASYIKQNNATQANILVQNGLNINMTDSKNGTLLMRAIQMGSDKYVDAFINSNVDIHKLDDNGYDAGMIAWCKSHCFTLGKNVANMTLSQFREKIQSNELGEKMQCGEACPSSCAISNQIWKKLSSYFRDYEQDILYNNHTDLRKLMTIKSCKNPSFIKCFKIK